MVEAGRNPDVPAYLKTQDERDHYLHQLYTGKQFDVDVEEVMTK